LAKGHFPQGSRRLPGPIRPLYLNKTFPATLREAVQPFGKGGLRGRYADEVEAHLEGLDALHARGEQMTATIFWDIENIGLGKNYHKHPKETMELILGYFAGLLQVPVTRVEAVEITRDRTTPEERYSDGKIQWATIIRQMGGVVHRAWPPMTDAADKVILERIGLTLDDMHRGDRNRILVLLSADKGFVPMLEAAQSEGVTILRFASVRGSFLSDANYYPGGCNFSVPFRMEGFGLVKKALLHKTLDPRRPPEEWLPEHGPPRHAFGVVALEPAPELELDRRVFHDFAVPKDPAPAYFDGSYRRPGPRLNDTLAAQLERALARTRKRELKPAAKDAVRGVLAAMGSELGDGKRPAAQLYWNFEVMELENMGPPMQEMLARIVRWVEGTVGMPVERVEVSKYVEPWEKLGAFAHDWLFHMDNLGMAIHRIWPPNTESANLALTNSVAAAAAQPNPPALICILSDFVPFDEGLRIAQRAGISVVQLGDDGIAIFYPAGADVRIPLDVLRWKTARKELSQSVRNPFLAGAAGTPDAPAPVGSFWMQRLGDAPPADKQWGKPEELDLQAGVRRAALVDTMA